MNTPTGGPSARFLRDASVGAHGGFSSLAPSLHSSKLLGEQCNAHLTMIARMKCHCDFFVQSTPNEVFWSRFEEPTGKRNAVQLRSRSALHNAIERATACAPAKLAALTVLVVLVSEDNLHAFTLRQPHLLSEYLPSLASESCLVKIHQHCAQRLSGISGAPTSVCNFRCTQARVRVWIRMVGQPAHCG